MNAGNALFALLNANATVTAANMLGTSPMRFYPGGVVPTGVDVAGKRYATWQTVGGKPANTFETAARSDNGRIQVCAYGFEDDRDSATELIEAIRVAIEDEAAQFALQDANPGFNVGISTLGPGDDYDDASSRYREMRDFSVWVSR